MFSLHWVPPLFPFKEGQDLFLSFFFLIHKSCFVITERLVSLCNSSAFHDSRKFGGKKENSHKNLSAAALSRLQTLSCLSCTSSGNLEGTRVALGELAGILNQELQVEA